MSDPQAPHTPTPAPRAVGPLGRVITLRMLATAVITLALLVGLLGVVISWQERLGAQQRLADARDHFVARTAQIDAEWIRQAEVLRGQIEFSGLLDGDDLPLAQARLTAFLTNMGGQGKFTHVLLIGRQGEELFRYATRSQARLQPASAGPLGWAYSAEDRLLYRSLREPLRLGTRNVDLVLFAPVDNALLAATAFPATTLSLHWGDIRDLATSDLGNRPPAPDAQRLQGVLPWAGDPAGPQLQVVRDLNPVVRLNELLALVLLGIAAGAALGWLVLGRWARGHVRRIGVLSRSTASFAAERKLSPVLARELDRALDGASNELHALGSGMKALMQNVAEAERAQHEAQDSLRELNTTLEQRVEARTRELELARDEALAASRAREQFLAAMSHELRTPLVGLLGGLELVDAHKLSETEGRVIDVARRSGDALRSVIDGVLDYAKLEAGPVALADQVFRADEVARDAVQLFGALALRRGLALNCHCAPEAAAPVHGDPVRLRQVLLNLLGNAVKFTDHGRVDLRVTLADAPAADPGSPHPVRRLRFAVEDTGVGIAPEAQVMIFRPFAQAGPASEPGRGGTGLGLAISQRLVDAMGGRITLDSAPGRGSIFAFELALPAAAPQPRLVPPSDPVPGALRGRVLLVDDNPVNRIIAGSMLARLQLDVQECEDGQQALQALRQDRYDVVLMDCQMPVLDGPGATRALRAGAAGERAARVPVVALTAHALDGDAQRCLNAGMNAYLSKPYTLAELADALVPWLGTEVARPG